MPNTEQKQENWVNSVVFANQLSDLQKKDQDKPGYRFLKLNSADKVLSGNKYNVIADGFSKATVIVPEFAVKAAKISSDPAKTFEKIKESKDGKDSDVAFDKAIVDKETKELVSGQHKLALISLNIDESRQYRVTLEKFNKETEEYEQKTIEIPGADFKNFLIENNKHNTKVLKDFKDKNYPKELLNSVDLTEDDIEKENVVEKTADKER